MKLGKRTLYCGFVIVAALLLLDSQGPSLALGQQKGGGGGGKQQGGPASRTEQKFLALFRDSVAKAAKSTVRILCDGKDMALGVVITPDGFILTKASDLTGKITVKLASGEEKEAKWVGHHQPHDLAMLKIDANNLTPIVFAESTVAPVGHFVASVGTGLDPVAVGVVSVAARDLPIAKDGGKKGGPINPTTGFLGVTTIDDPKGAKVESLSKFGGGKGGKKGGGGGGGFNNPNAGKIKEGDIILALGEKVIKDSDSLKNELQKHKAGQEITLKLLRGEEELELKLKLNAQPNGQKADQNKMGSELSERRNGFPIILQHDSVVRPTDCGGPLCDLEGRVIGLNICRWGRVESYAVPSEVIKPLLGDLMTGKLAPKQ